MLFASNGTIPPLEWKHDPIITDKDNWTVAMILADKGIIPTKEWEHDPVL